MVSVYIIFMPSYEICYENISIGYYDILDITVFAHQKPAFIWSKKYSKNINIVNIIII